MNYTQFYKKATMSKRASDELLYKVARLLKKADSLQLRLLMIKNRELPAHLTPRQIHLRKARDKRRFQTDHKLNPYMDYLVRDSVWDLYKKNLKNGYREGWGGIKSLYGALESTNRLLLQKIDSRDKARARRLELRRKENGTGVSALLNGWTAIKRYLDQMWHGKRTMLL